MFKVSNIVLSSSYSFLPYRIFSKMHQDHASAITTASLGGTQRHFR